MPLKTVDAQNPITCLAQFGVQTLLPSVAEPPDAAVIRSLLALWNRIHQAVSPSSEGAAPTSVSKRLVARRPCHVQCLMLRTWLSTKSFTEPDRSIAALAVASLKASAS